MVEPTAEPRLLPWGRQLRARLEVELAHPSYRRDKLSASYSVLQEILNPQAIEIEPVAPLDVSSALQDLCITQPAIFVGLISVLTGRVLQDDLLATARVFQRRARDILNRIPEICDPEPT